MFRYLHLMQNDLAFWGPEVEELTCKTAEGEVSEGCRRHRRRSTDISLEISVEKVSAVFCCDANSTPESGPVSEVEFRFGFFDSN
jgi:hypothetical protein